MMMDEYNPGKGILLMDHPSLITHPTLITHH